MMTIIEKINGWHPVLISIIALGIGMTDVAEWLKVITYGVTIGYMIWKWRCAYKDRNKKTKTE